jgi:hypothetical protein
LVLKQNPIAISLTVVENLFSAREIVSIAIADGESETATDVVVC